MGKRPLLWQVIHPLVQDLKIKCQSVLKTISHHDAKKDVPADANVVMAVYKNHTPYITASSAVFVNCKSNSGYEEASFDVRKMYVDQDNAPSNIMISP